MKKQTNKEFKPKESYYVIISNITYSDPDLEIFNSLSEAKECAGNKDIILEVQPTKMFKNTLELKEIKL